jgi:hypothetical protein
MGTSLLFLSDRDGSFKPYAHRLADGAFFEVDLSPGPSPTRGGEQWELGPQVPIEPEPFPPWDGFPDTGYPITSYDPRPSLEPKILVPLPGTGQSQSCSPSAATRCEQHRVHACSWGSTGSTLQPSGIYVRYDEPRALGLLRSRSSAEGWGCTPSSR